MPGAAFLYCVQYFDLITHLSESLANILIYSHITNLQFASTKLIAIYSNFNSTLYCGQVEHHILIVYFIELYQSDICYFLVYNTCVWL